MTLKAPLKFSAVGLSLLAIAVSSCNNKAGKSGTDNNTPAPLNPNGGDTPRSTKLKNFSLKVAQTQIPAGTCTSYQVSATNEADETINITDLPSVVVKLDPQFKTKFSVDNTKNLLCAYSVDTNKTTKEAASVGSKAVLIATNTTNVTSVAIEAINTTDFVDIDTIAPITASVGNAITPFDIKIKQTLHGAFESAKSTNAFNLFDNENNPVELKSKLVGGNIKFYFDIPKTAQTGQHTYTLRSKTNEHIHKEITVTISEATLKAIVLKQKNGAALPNILKANNELALNVKGLFSDDTEHNLTAADKNYTLVLGNGTHGGAYNNTNQQLTLTVPDAPAEADAFLPTKLIFTATKDSSSSTHTVPYYINHKPTLSKVEFTQTPATPDETTPVTSDVVAIGGAAETTAVERNKRCARLSSASFVLNNPTAININLTDLQMTVPENSPFVIQNNSYVCAKSTAALNDKVTVTIASKDDASVKLEKIFTAGQAYTTKKIALTNNNVANYSITFSPTVTEHSLQFNYLNSDDTVSDKAVTANDIQVVTNPKTSSYFAAAKEGTGETAVWKVKIKNDALPLLQNADTVSQSLIVTGVQDASFNTEVSITFSKN